MSTFQRNLLHNQCGLEGLERMWVQDDDDDDDDDDDVEKYSKKRMSKLG
jgi:hypothetical protein